MATRVEAGIVRVHDADGRVVGAGFLAGHGRVVTCAHVVAQALTLPDGAAPLGAEVMVDLPLVEPGRLLRAAVTVWEPPRDDDSGDVAGLTLGDPLPTGAHPTRLLTADDLWSHRFRTFGFPAGYDAGVWVSGHLRGRQAAGWVQMEELSATGYRIQPGFSGGPVWDDELDGVVGMAVAAETRGDVRAGYLVRTETLVEAWPVLAEEAHPPCPYRGLSAFREQDAALFFGRDETSEQLLDEVTRRRLVAVVGPSGSGKSSLVFAGVVPRVRERPGWLVASMRPSQASSPLGALAAALVTLLEPGMSETQRLGELGRLETLLAEGRLPDVVDRCLAHVRGEHLLLVVDQFEELYSHPPETVRSFVDRLTSAVARRPDGGEPPATVVLTLRADFLGHSLQQAALASAMRDGTLVIGQMTRDQLRQSIVGPPGDEVSFEPGLVERILDDVGDDAGGLPLLEFALTLLWDKQADRVLTHAAYDELGGVDGAVARYAEEVYLRDLSAVEREAARRLLVQLVAPGQVTGRVRRVARSTELDPTRWHLAQRLATTRLLVAGRDAAGVETVELVHEALIPGWARLREWVDADQEFRAWQERLRDNVQAWHDSGQDDGALLRGVPLAEAERWSLQRPDDLGPEEKRYVEASRALHGRSLGRLRAVVAGLALLLVASLVLGGLAIRESQRADLQSRLVVSRYLVDQAADLERTQPVLAMLLGIAAYETEETPETVDHLVRAASALPDTTALLEVGEGRVRAVAVDPADPDRLAVVDGTGSVSLWDLASRQRSGDLPAADTNVLAFSPDGRLVATAGAREVQVWEVSSLEPVVDPLPSVPDEVAGLAFGPDGDVLAACAAGAVAVWDLGSRDEPWTTPRTGPVESCEPGYSPDGRVLYAPDGGDVVTWDLVERTRTRTDAVPYDPEIWGPEGDSPPPEIVSFAAGPTGDTAMVVTTAGDGAWLWDLPDGAAQPIRGGPVDAVRSTFSSDGGSVAVVGGQYMGDYGYATLIDVASAATVRAVRTPGEEVLDVAIADDQTLAVATPTGSVAILSTGRSAGIPSPYGAAVVTASGDELVSVSPSGGLRRWALDTGEPVGEAVPLPDPASEIVGTVELSADGRKLALDRYDPDTDTRTGITIWDPATGAVTEVPATNVTAEIHLSPDGTVLAMVEMDDMGEAVEFSTWDTGSGDRLAVTPLNGRGATMAFDPAGDVVAVATEGEAGSLALWDVADLEPLETLASDASYYAPSFSADGRWLAAGGESGFGIWDLAARRQATRLAADGWGAGAFSPDASRFAAPDRQGLAVWDRASGDRVASLAGFGGILGFGRDEDELLVTDDVAVSRQRFGTDWAHEHLCGVVGRQLTREEWETYVPGRGYEEVCAGV